MQRAILILSALATLGCAATGPGSAGPAQPETELAGMFLADNSDFSQFLKIRRTDHTYTEYRYQVLDFLRPPAIAVTLEGTWSVQGKQYRETVTRSSYEPWNTLVGQPQSFDIVQLTPEMLLYFSRDGAPIRERKLTPAEAAPLRRDPFSFVPDATRQKYGFEQH